MYGAWKSQRKCAPDCAARLMVFASGQMTSARACAGNPLGFQLCGWKAADDVFISKMEIPVKISASETGAPRISRV